MRLIALVGLVVAGCSSSHHTIADAGVTDGSIEIVDASHVTDGSSSQTSSALNGGAAQGSAGCGKTGAAMGLQSVAMMVDGSMRTGEYVIPDGYDPALAYPVVFVFHGDGGTGAQIRTALDLETVAGGKAIFVYPDGANMTWDDTIGMGSSNADMDFVMALRSQLRDDYCVDLDRTFATGHSRGAYFVNQLACQYGSAEFAAMAPHSGTIGAASDNDYVYGPANPNGGPYIPGEYDFVCPFQGNGTTYKTPPTPAPPAMLVIHGQCDTEDGVTFAEGVISVEHWAYGAQCSSTPDVVSQAASCGTTRTCPTLAGDPCYTTPGCASGHDVTFCAVPSLPHAVWCEAPMRIWSFFAAH